MNRTLRDAIELASDYPEHPAAVRILASTGKKKRPARSFNGGTTLKERKAAKKSAAREEMATLRAEVVARAGGRCEVWAGEERCHERGTDLDHWLSGSGLRRQNQSKRTCWLLCRWDHQARTDNYPTAARWNQLFAAHCIRHGYPAPKMHIEHAPLRAKAGP